MTYLFLYSPSTVMDHACAHAERVERKYECMSQFIRYTDYIFFVVNTCFCFYFASVVMTTYGALQNHV